MNHPAGKQDLLRIRDIHHVYADEGIEVEALSGVTLTVRAGEFIAIVGQSGSGKSTLLHVMGAMDRPRSGEVWLAGRDIAGLDDESRTVIRQRDVGFVFQFFNLLPTLDLCENVMLPALLAGIDATAAQQKAEDLLRAVGLAGLGARRATSLSGGERQRGAIARALVNDAPLLLADEPTGNLDSATGADIIRLLRRLPASRGTTVVLATHAAELARVADRVVTMRDGRIESEEAAGPGRGGP